MDAEPPKRDPVPPAPDPRGGYLVLEQPNLFWRAWDLLQEDTRLAHVTRAGWRRYAVETAAGRAEARFDGPRLLLGALIAAPAPLGARILAPGGALALRYRSEEEPYPAVHDEAGPAALFGDLKGSGFSAAGKVWVADRLLARGDEAVRALAMCVLALRERPGAFR